MGTSLQAHTNYARSMAEGFLGAFGGRVEKTMEDLEKSIKMALR